MVYVLFAMAFVLGPALFLVMSRRDGRRWPLALVASVMVILSFALRNEASLSVFPDLVQVFASVALIWVAWVLVLVIVAQALRATYPTSAMRRWSRVIGAMGTTVPWFGFAAAQMMVR